MATSREGTSLPASPPVHPKRTVQCPRYLDDYFVEYRGQRSIEQMHRHEEEREQHSPARSTSSLPPMQNVHEAIMHQALETAQQQSETAKKQTELLDYVLQRHSPRSSAQSGSLRRRLPV